MYACCVPYFYTTYNTRVYALCTNVQATQNLKAYKAYTFPERFLYVVLYQTTTQIIDIVVSPRRIIYVNSVLCCIVVYL